MSYEKYRLLSVETYLFIHYHIIYYTKKTPENLTILHKIQSKYPYRNVLAKYIDTGGIVDSILTRLTYKIVFATKTRYFEYM